MRADRLGFGVGDEAQIERTRRIGRGRYPVGCTGGPDVDLLLPEGQRDSAAAELDARHAEHSYVPVHAGVDVPRIQDDVVDAIDAQAHVTPNTARVSGTDASRMPLRPSRRWSTR